LDDRFEGWLKRIAEAEQLEGRPHATSRRGLVSRIAHVGLLFASGLATVIGSADAAAGQSRGLRKGKFRVAQEDGVIEDALGKRRVRRGDYIYDSLAPARAVGEVGTQNTARQCGVGLSSERDFVTRLGRNWEELNCRLCPFQNSRVRFAYAETDAISVVETAPSGTEICRGRLDGRASSVWYRTVYNCWVWSGGTRDTNWNRDC